MHLYYFKKTRHYGKKITHWHTDYDLRNLEGMELPVNQFADYRADADNPIPVIYQSGYLTVKGYDKEFQSYTLGFPNDEVKYGFLNFLLL